MEPLTQASPTQASPTWKGTIRDAVHFVGRILEVSGVKSYIHSFLERTYGHLTGDPYRSVDLENNNLIGRKIQKLRQQGRTYQIKSGCRLLDFFGFVQSSRILLYHSPDSSINYNSRISRQRKGKSERVECRHLAYAYVSGAIGRGPGKFREVETEDEIQNSSVIPDDDTFHKTFYYKGIPYRAVYFNLQTFSDALYFLVQENTGNNRADYLFGSTNHSMGLSFVEKTGGEIEVFFYDPNYTCRHTKIITRCAEELKKLSIDDLIPEHFKNYYFPKGLESGCLLSLETKKKQKECRVRCFGNLDKGGRYLLSKYGHYGATDICGQPSQLDNGSKKELLAGKWADEEPALLNMAAQNGHTETVEVFD